MMSPLPTIDETALPPQLRRLVRALGWERAWTLINERGGQRIKLPQRHNDVRLAEVIGPEGVQRLRAEFRDQLWMDVPKPDKVHQQIRHRAARELRARGATLNEVAAATGMSRRHVINICRDMPQPTPNRTRSEQQADLFEGWPEEGAETGLRGV